MAAPPDDEDPPDPFRFDRDELDEAGTPAVGPEPRRPGSHADAGRDLDPDAERPTPGSESHTDAGPAPDAPRPTRRSLTELPEVAVRRAGDIGGTWMLSVLFLSVVIVLIVFTVFRRDEPVVTLEVGDRFPAFAAPLATRPRLEFDAVNLAERDDQGDLGRVAACSVRDPSVITSCALLDRGPLIVVLYDATDPDCAPAGDELQRLATTGTPVQRLVVAGGGEHDETARTVRDRRWTVPVAYDRDGEFTRRLGKPDCAATFAVRRDRRVVVKRVGVPTSASLAATARALTRR